ncbi:hypothetical protein AALA22_09035 [Anaerovoracaceae bacterium 41-7]
MTIKTLSLVKEKPALYEHMGLAETTSYYKHERQSVFVTAVNRRKAIPTAIYARLTKAKGCEL